MLEFYIYVVIALIVLLSIISTIFTDNMTRTPAYLLLMYAIFWGLIALYFIAQYYVELFENVIESLD